MEPLPLLRELVARVTVSGDAAPQRNALGLVTEVLRERAPHLEVTTGPDPDQPWTLLRTPTDADRPQLLLACHVDTVPVPDPGQWQRDPFGADLDGECPCGPPGVVLEAIDGVSPCWHGRRGSGSGRYGPARSTPGPVPAAAAGPPRWR